MNLANASAQSPNILQECFNWLSKNDYSPKHNDTYVSFGANGTKYAISWAEKDKAFLSITAYFNGIDDVPKYIIKCNELNSTKKFIKASIDDDNCIELAIEIMLDNNPEVGSLLKRSISTLATAERALIED